MSTVIIIGYGRRRRGRRELTYPSAIAALAELAHCAIRDIPVVSLRTADGVLIDVDMLGLYAAQERQEWRAGTGEIET